MRSTPHRHKCPICEMTAPTHKGVQLREPGARWVRHMICHPCYILTRSLLAEMIAEPAFWHPYKVVITLLYLPVSEPTDDLRWRDAWAGDHWSGTTMGLWMPGIKTMALALDLSPVELRETIVHELIHGLRGDDATVDEVEVLVDALATQIVAERRANPLWVPRRVAA